MTAPPLIVSILHWLMRYATTRDAEFVSRENRFVATVLIDGEEENLKVTTPVDLILAEAILLHREGKL